MLLDITRCKSDRRVYIFCHKDDTLFKIYEDAIQGLFTGEEYEVIQRNTKSYRIGVTIDLHQVFRTTTMNFKLKLETKHLSCGHMVGMYETGTACGCWTCPICSERGVCNAPLPSVS